MLRARRRLFHHGEQPSSASPHRGSCVDQRIAMAGRRLRFVLRSAWSSSAICRTRLAVVESMTTALMLWCWNQFENV